MVCTIVTRLVAHFVSSNHRYHSSISVSEDRIDIFTRQIITIRLAAFLNKNSGNLSLATMMIFTPSVEGAENFSQTPTACAVSHP